MLVLASTHVYAMTEVVVCSKQAAVVVNRVEYMFIFSTPLWLHGSRRRHTNCCIRYIAATVATPIAYQRGCGQGGGVVRLPADSIPEGVPEDVGSSSAVLLYTHPRGGLW